MNRLKLRKLRKARTEFERANRYKLDYLRLSDPESSIPPELQMQAWQHEVAIRIVESEKLRELALKWNIEIKKSWLDLRCTEGGEFITPLTDEGIAFIKDTIRNRRRENIEWWITKVLAPIAGIVIALLGALLAFLKLRP